MNSSLPEDVTALIASHVDFVDILQLRKANHFFERVTRVRMVLVGVYQGSNLALPLLEDGTPVIEFERRLVFATQLDRRLAIPHPTPRSGWTIELPEDVLTLDQKILESGTHLVALYENPELICADLETRESWTIPLPHAGSDEHMFDVVKFHMEGRDGLLIAYVEHSDITVYFHPFDTRTAPGSSRLILYRQFKATAIVTTVALAGSKLLVGFMPSGVSVFDLDDGEHYDYSLSGQVSRLALNNDHLIAACIYSQNNHLEIFLDSHPLPDTNHSATTNSVSIPLEMKPSFSRNRHHPPNSQYPRAVSLFATSAASVFRMDIEHFLPDADSNGVGLQPISHSVQSNISSYLFPDDLSSDHPLKSFIPTTKVSCGAACFGSARAVIAMQAPYEDFYHVDEWQLVLITFEGQRIHHRSLHLHDTEAMRALDVSTVEWDETSGRLCLGGFYADSGDPSPIIILEF